MPWGLLTFLIGIAFGYFSPGKSDKSRMFVRGLWIGLIIAVVLGLLSFVFDVNPLGLESSLLGTFIAIAVLTIVFILGVWLGDALEGWNDRRREKRHVGDR